MAKLRYSTDGKMTWTDVEAPLPITLPRNTTHIEAIGNTVILPAWNAPDFDFAAGRYAYNGPYSNTLPAEFVFTRTGAGTAQKADGSYVSFDTGVPRITDRGLLVEATRTNLLSRSTPGGAGWGFTSGAQATPAAPWGPFSAFSIAGGGNDWHRTSLLVSVQAGNPYAVQVIYRAGTSGRVRVVINSSGDETAVRGLVGGPSVIASAAGPVTNLVNESVGVGIYRVSFIITPTVTGAITLGVGPDTSTVGQTVDGLYAGIEAGAFATSPIITTGVAATRGIDDARLSHRLTAGQDFTIYAEASFTRTTGELERLFEYDSGTSANRIVCNRGTNGRMQLSVLVDNIGSDILGPVVANGTTVKLAITRQAGVVRFYVAGAKSGEGAFALPDLTSLFFGKGRTSAQLQDNLRRLQILPYALSEAEAVDMTK